MNILTIFGIGAVIFVVFVIYYEYFLQGKYNKFTEIQKDRAHKNQMIYVEKDKADVVTTKEQYKSIVRDPRVY